MASLVAADCWTWTLAYLAAATVVGAVLAVGMKIAERWQR